MSDSTPESSISCEASTDLFKFAVNKSAENGVPISTDQYAMQNKEDQRFILIKKKYTSDTIPLSAQNGSISENEDTNCEETTQIFSSPKLGQLLGGISPQNKEFIYAKHPSLTNRKSTGGTLRQRCDSKTSYFNEKVQLTV